MKRLCGVLLLSLLVSNAYAELKIGVVNLEEVIQKSPLAVSFNQKLSSDYKPRQDAVNAAQKKLQDDVDQLTYSGYKMSAAEKTKLQNTINADKSQLDQLTVALQRDIANSQAQYTQDLMGKLNTVISKIAQDGKYDLIQTNGNVLYINNAINLTPQVIDQLK